MKERKADLRTLHQPGTYLGTEDRAALDLACAMHRAESTDRSIDASWSAQERAQNYFNEHGLAATLDEMFRLRALALPCWNREDE